MSVDPTTINQLQDWASSPSGRSLIEAEAAQLAAVLPTLYGPTIVQLGAPSLRRFLEASESLTKILACPRAGHGNESLVAVARPEALPFDARSVGQVLLPHVLEFSEDPHQVLREVSRVLVPEGHAVILGFNPYSSWGLRRMFQRQSRAPWSGRFYGLSRVEDWLSVLGFETVSGRMLYFRPPTNSVRLRSRLRFLEQAGDRWWPMFAAVYLLVARKREVGMTAIRPSWKRNAHIKPGLAEPVARNG